MTLNGIDVLERDGFDIIDGANVGLVTNHTGLTADGRKTIDLLHNAPNVNLKALFGPEHGIRGIMDDDVLDGVDAMTGLPVYSLYGERKQPTADQFDGIDTLLFDIQDIGCRFYTYISTLGNVMQAAGRHGKRMVVLDRLNPITGLHVEGPVADHRPIDEPSFVAYHPIPVRHGMTAGELGRMFNDEREFGCDLQVVACEGWNRADWFDSAGLMWTNPSPNMRSLTQATLYPGIGLVELTNVSVGRGTDTPFEVVGAPYIDARSFAVALNDAAIPGVRFVPVRYTPRSSVFKDEDCGGVNVLVTDRDAFDAVCCGLTVAVTLRRLYPEWEPDKLIKLLANDECYRRLVDDREGYEELAKTWSASLLELNERRNRYLIYGKA